MKLDTWVWLSNAIIWKVIDLICMCWYFPENSSKKGLSEYVEILYTHKHAHKYLIPCTEHLKNLSLKKYQSSKQKEKMSSQCPSLGSGSGFNPQVRKIPWRREWQPTPVSLPGEFCGQRSLVGYSLCVRKNSQTQLRNWHFQHFFATNRKPHNNVQLRSMT